MCYLLCVGKHNPYLNQFVFLFLVCATLIFFSLPVSKAYEDDVRQRFRPIEKLKEEFRELKVQLETDFEIMFKLINKFNSSTSTLEEKIGALHDLEYYVHQVRGFSKPERHAVFWNCGVLNK